MNKPMCICSFNVVLTYNDGRRVEPEIFDAIEAALVRQWEGFTDEGHKTGNWRGQREVSAWYSVYTEPERIWILRQIINEIGLKLGQSQIALEISPASAELIDIVPEDQPEKPPPKPKKKGKQGKKPTAPQAPFVLWKEEDT